MRRAQLLLLFIACAFTAQAAAEYPDHPIRMIVPQAAGSATDTITRVLGSALSDELHQQVVIDDRPGGALTLGLDLRPMGTRCAWARSAPSQSPGTWWCRCPMTFNVTSSRSRWWRVASFCSRSRRRPRSTLCRS